MLLYICCDRLVPHLSLLTGNDFSVGVTSTVLLLVNRGPQHVPSIVNLLSWCPPLFFLPWFFVLLLYFLWFGTLSVCCCVSFQGVVFGGGGCGFGQLAVWTGLALGVGIFGMFFSLIFISKFLSSLLGRTLSMQLPVLVQFLCFCPDGDLYRGEALLVSCLSSPSCMTVAGSHFWFDRSFRSPLCCDAPFSNSISCACCSFNQDGSRVILLSLLVGIVLWCACLRPMYWLSSFPELLWMLCPLAWPFRAVRYPWRICNVLGSGPASFCDQGQPCGGVGSWIDCCLALVCSTQPFLLVVFPTGASTSVLSSCLAVSYWPSSVARQQRPGWWIGFLLCLRLVLCWCRQLGLSLS